MSKLLGSIMIVIGILLCFGAYSSIGSIDQSMEKQTDKTIGTVYKCDFPLFKDAGFHNNIEFVTARGETVRFYQSTIELLSVNNKVSVRYNPANPHDDRQIDSWIEIFIISEGLAFSGVVTIITGVCTFFPKKLKMP
jgi:hypothetical protein